MNDTLYTLTCHAGKHVLICVLGHKTYCSLYTHVHVYVHVHYMCVHVLSEGVGGIEYVLDRRARKHVFAYCVCVFHGIW